MHVSCVQNVNSPYVAGIPLKTTTNPLKPLKTDMVTFSGSSGRYGLSTNDDINFSNLSERVVLNPKGRDYTIVSMPKSMELSKVNVEGKEIEIPLRKEGEKANPCIAVIDLFSNNSKKNIKVGKRDNISHGDAVSKIAINGLEDKVELLAFNASDGNSSQMNWELTNQALKDILEMKKRGTNIDAVTISAGLGVSYGNLSYALDKPVDKYNIGELKEEIIEAYKKIGMKQAVDSIENINKLVENGVKVYLAAGNELFTLQDLSKATVVGGLSKSGAKKYPSCDVKMPLISDYAKAEFDLKNLKDKLGEFYGVGDEDIVFSKDEVFDKIGLFSKQNLQGSSFASPLALNKYMKNKIG